MCVIFVLTNILAVVSMTYLMVSSYKYHYIEQRDVALALTASPSRSQLVYSELISLQNSWWKIWGQKVWDKKFGEWVDHARKQ